MGKPFNLLSVAKGHCSELIKFALGGQGSQKEEGTRETSYACLMLCGGRPFADGLKAELQLEIVLKDLSGPITYAGAL